MFSALVKKNGRAWWTPMYAGGKRAAKEFMRSNPHAVECSIIQQGRFVTTVKPTDKGDQHGYHL